MLNAKKTPKDEKKKCKQKDTKFLWPRSWKIVGISIKLLFLHIFIGMSFSCDNLCVFVVQQIVRELS